MEFFNLDNRLIRLSDVRDFAYYNNEDTNEYKIVVTFEDKERENL